MIAQTMERGEVVPHGQHWRLALVGLGNIGSTLVGLLRDLPAGSSVLLVDHDRYDASNTGQGITTRDLQKWKVDVQARCLRRLNPKLRVHTFARAVEQVPLGFLRVDVILGAVDTLAARLYLNEVALHLGVVFVDSGILADGLLARVSVIVPGAQRVCFACGLDDEAFAAIEQAYPCAGAGPDREAAAPRTNAPSCLGALAAALQALETLKLLSGSADVAEGCEILLEARRHAHTVSRLPYNPCCRVEHDPWTIRPLERRAGEMTLGDALALATPPGGNGAVGVASAPPPVLRMFGRRFCLTLECPRGHARDFVHVASTLRAARARCRTCGGALAPGRHDLVDRLERDALPAGALAITLGKLGMRRGDIFSVAGEQGESHYEVVA